MILRKVWVLHTVTDHGREYLRYGVDLCGVTTWCLYRGEIACFETKERAMMVKNMFDRPSEWAVECFIKEGAKK